MANAQKSSCFDRFMMACGRNFMQTGEMLYRIEIDMLLNESSMILVYLSFPYSRSPLLTTS